MTKMRNHILLITTITVISLLQTQTSADNSTQLDLSSIPALLEKSNVSGDAIHDFKKFIGANAGEVTEGLSKVKKYLQRYGYINIPDSATNFTDSFDETLVSAIKSYQKFYNLAQTGQLDTKTVGHMILPRCGNRDVGHHHTSHAQSSHHHQHTVGHYMYFPGNPRWDKFDLTFAFSPENYLSENYKKTIRRAFARWKVVTPLTFTELESYDVADIKIAFYSGDHGDGGPFDGPLGQLAHAFEPPAGFFHFDKDEKWVVDGEPPKLPLRSRAVDLESVAVHEIGHLLGLGHSSDPNSVMFATLPTSARKVDLQKDDIAGIQSIYGSATKFTSAQPPVTPPSEANRIFSEAAVAVNVASLWSNMMTILVAVALVNNIFLWYI